MARQLRWTAMAMGLLLVAGLASMIRIVPATESAPAATSLSPKTPPLAADGALAIPVDGVRREALIDTWGDARGEGMREHHAIDIMAPRGTPVRAAAAGVVEKIFESVPGGHTVYVRMPGGATIHYYAHLDSYADGLHQGQQLQQGDPIGRVGSTGDASPEAPHLHFEVKQVRPGERWWEGREVNPYPLLAGSARDR